MTNENYLMLFETWMSAFLNRTLYDQGSVDVLWTERVLIGYVELLDTSKAQIDSMVSKIKVFGDWSI